MISFLNLLQISEIFSQNLSLNSTKYNFFIKKKFKEIYNLNITQLENMKDSDYQLITIFFIILSFLLLLFFSVIIFSIFKFKEKKQNEQKKFKIKELPREIENERKKPLYVSYSTVMDDVEIM